MVIFEIIAPFLREKRNNRPRTVIFRELLGSLSSDVFERRTSTGSEVFSLLTCLDDIKFVFLSFFTVIETIRLKIWAKPPSKNEKRPLPVDVRHSKTLLLKLPIIIIMIIIIGLSLRYAKYVAEYQVTACDLGYSVPSVLSLI